MRIPWLAFLLIALPSPSLAVEYPARVVGITDGDTLTVLKADKAQVKVRLHGIDSPESGQDFGSRAKQAASGLAFGKDVIVRQTDTDRYGRTVGEILLPDGRSLNREMVRQGLAWWYREYAPNDRELARLEAEARKAGRGLWGQGSPVAPWDWRHGKGLPVVAGVIANKRSKVYHSSQCASIGRMNEGNKLAFGTAAAAEAAGYRKAGDCR